MSLSKAAKQSGTTLRTLRKYAGTALEVRSGRLDVKPSDRLVRHMRMLTPTGEITVRVTSSRTASRIADYNNALRHYLVWLDDSKILKFKGKAIRAGGKTYEFVTDYPTISRLVRVGAARFSDIYASDGGPL